MNKPITENPPAETSFKILLVEDNPGDARLIQETLSEIKKIKFELEYVTRLSSGINILKNQDIALIILDLNLPDSQGVDTLKTIFKHADDIPIVILSGLSAEEIAVETLKIGAQDYLLKGQIDAHLLGRSIRYAIERKKTEKIIKASLAEKTVLLQEIHHRIKNNLQLIISLLRIQSSYVTSPHNRDLFKVCQNRVYSISLIHERLFHSQEQTRIDFPKYIKELTIHLYQIFKKSESSVQFEIKAEKILLDLNTAIPCGLILNELVSNILKHAFPKGKKGKFHITMTSPKNNHYKLMIKDNGVGLPDNVNPHNPDALGLQLVKDLTKQLNGSLKFNRKIGTSYTILFSLNNS